MSIFCVAAAIKKNMFGVMMRENRNHKIQCNKKLLSLKIEGNYDQHMKKKNRQYCAKENIKYRLVYVSRFNLIRTNSLKIHTNNLQFTSLYSYLLFSISSFYRIYQISFLLMIHDDIYSCRPARIYNGLAHFHLIYVYSTYIPKTIIRREMWQLSAMIFDVF